MTAFEMTKDEAAALARYIELIRKRLPGEVWHKPGIENALGSARKRADSPDLAAAAIAAARRPENRTPAVIGMDGPHWREASRPPRPEQLDNAGRCSICYESQQGCVARWSDDHEFESVAAANAKRLARKPESVKRTVAALKDELAPIAPPPPARGLDALEARNPKLKAAVDRVRASLPGVAGDAAEVGGQVSEGSEGE
jgi:hypothetical protein